MHDKSLSLLENVPEWNIIICISDKSAVFVLMHFLLNDSLAVLTSAEKRHLAPPSGPKARGF